MKRTLTIILLSISLSGFSQTEKGDFVITPTVGWDTYRKAKGNDFIQMDIVLPITVYKYLGDKLAVGLMNNFYYREDAPNTTGHYYTNFFNIRINPEVRYNFLKSRFTPFISGDINLFYLQTTFSDVPQVPVEFRRYTDSGFFLKHAQIDIGISYFIKERFGLQVKLMDVQFGTFNGRDINFYTPINFGLQFIINNPRSEIESPR